MKKLVLLLLSLVGTPTIQAQWTLDVLGGVNVSSAKYQSKPFIIETAPTSDFFIGTTPRISLSNRIGIATDILYNRRGYEIPANGQKGDRIRVHFLELVPQFECRVIGPLALTAGVYWAKKLRESISVRGGQWSKSLSGSQAASDYGWNVGARTKLGQFTAIVRYSRGLADVATLIFTDDTGQELGDLSQFMSNWQFGIGCQL